MSTNELKDALTKLRQFFDTYDRKTRIPADIIENLIMPFGRLLYRDKNVHFMEKAMILKLVRNAYDQTKKDDEGRDHRRKTVQGDSSTKTEILGSSSTWGFADSSSSIKFLRQGEIEKLFPEKATRELNEVLERAKERFSKTDAKSPKGESSKNKYVEAKYVFDDFPIEQREAIEIERLLADPDIQKLKKQFLYLQDVLPRRELDQPKEAKTPNSDEQELLLRDTSPRLPSNAEIPEITAEVQQLSLTGAQTSGAIPKKPSSMQSKSVSSDMLILTGDKDDPLHFNPDFLENPITSTYKSAEEASTNLAIEKTLENMNLDSTTTPLQPPTNLDNRTEQSLEIMDLDQVAIPPQPVHHPEPEIEIERIEQHYGADVRNPRLATTIAPTTQPSKKTPKKRMLIFKEKPSLFEGIKIKRFQKKIRKIVPRSHLERHCDFDDLDYGVPITSIPDEIRALFEVTNDNEFVEDSLQFLLPETPTRPEVVIESVDILPNLGEEQMLRMMTGTTERATPLTQPTSTLARISEEQPEIIGEGDLSTLNINTDPEIMQIPNPVETQTALDPSSLQISEASHPVPRDATNPYLAATPIIVPETRDQSSLQITEPSHTVLRDVHASNFMTPSTQPQIPLHSIIAQAERSNLGIESSLLPGSVTPFVTGPTESPAAIAEPEEPSWLINGYRRNWYEILKNRDVSRGYIPPSTPSEDTPPRRKRRRRRNIQQRGREMSPVFDIPPAPRRSRERSPGLGIGAPEVSDNLPLQNVQQREREMSPIFDIPPFRSGERSIVFGSPPRRSMGASEVLSNLPGEQQLEDLHVPFATTYKDQLEDVPTISHSIPMETGIGKLVKRFEIDWTKRIENETMIPKWWDKRVRLMQGIVQRVHDVKQGTIYPVCNLSDLKISDREPVRTFLNNVIKRGVVKLSDLCTTNDQDGDTYKSILKEALNSKLVLQNGENFNINEKK